MTTKISTESKMCVRCGMFHPNYYLQPHCTACRERIYLEQCLAKSQDAFKIAEMLQDAYDDEDGYDY